MATPHVQFKSADDPSAVVSIPADAQTAVTPGDRPGTAIVTTAAGERYAVAGDYREVHVRIQAAAARAHETGAAEQANTPVS